MFSGLFQVSLGIFSLLCSSIGVCLRLLSTLWSDSCLFDIFPISFLNFTILKRYHYLIFELTWPKGPSELFSSLGVRRPSLSVVIGVNILHFELLLENHWMEWNQTWHECSLWGADQELLLFSRSIIQDGYQRGPLFNIGPYGKCIQKSST